MDVAGVSIPSREVGGDLFYFLPLDEGRLGVALGDVSGKSVPAALLMSNVLAALRTEARLRGEVNESLSRINELIVEQVEPGRFVTLFYGIVDSGAGEVRYASAGHNPPLRVSVSGEVTWLDNSGVPLGVVPDARYASATASFQPGDVLVLYSDGITEAMKLRAKGSTGDDMEFFDEDRLVEIVLKVRTRSATEIIAGILEAVARFAGDTPQADDMTLVVIRMKPAAAPA
jgi:sigma-B regulation protein RsbU (phosphoserine phosphatase)